MPPALPYRAVPASTPGNPETEQPVRFKGTGFLLAAMQEYQRMAAQGQGREEIQALQPGTFMAYTLANDLPSALMPWAATTALKLHVMRWQGRAAGIRASQLHCLVVWVDRAEEALRNKSTIPMVEMCLHETPGVRSDTDWAPIHLARQIQTVLEQLTPEHADRDYWEAAFGLIANALVEAERELRGLPTDEWLDPHTLAPLWFAAIESRFAFSDAGWYDMEVSGPAVQEQEHPYLSLALVSKLEALAAKWKVSEVARSERGFLTAYKQAGGDKNRLSSEWRNRREGFIARHLKQLESGRALWRDGWITAQHLGLVMWAYSPEPKQVEEFAQRLVLEQAPGRVTAGFPLVPEVSGPSGMTPEEFSQLQARLRQGQASHAVPGVDPKRQGRKPEEPDPEYPVPVNEGAFYRSTVEEALGRLPDRQQVLCALKAVEMVWPFARHAGFSAEGLRQLNETYTAFLAAVLEPEQHLPAKLEPLIGQLFGLIDMQDRPGYIGNEDDRLALLRYALVSVVEELRFFTLRGQTQSRGPITSDIGRLMVLVIDVLRFSQPVRGPGDQILSPGAEEIESAHSAPWLQLVGPFLQRWWSECRRMLAFADAPSAEVSGPRVPHELGPTNSIKAVEGRASVRSDWLPAPRAQSVTVPEIEGFTYLRTEAFSTPVVPETWVDIFVFEPFRKRLVDAQVILPDETHPACEFVLIPGGRFLMGAPEGVGTSDEHPQHEVEVPAFFMARTACVFVFGPENLPRGTKEIPPIVGISWDESDAWTREQGLRLPTEAEWEYACRAKSVSTYCYGYYPSLLPEWGWAVESSEGHVHPVAQLRPNAFGLFDMHGNVWESCADNWHQHYRDTPTDGSAWIKAGVPVRVCRGGSWINDAEFCTSAYRNRQDPTWRLGNQGFRPAASIPTDARWVQVPLRTTARGVVKGPTFGGPRRQPVELPSSAYARIRTAVEHARPTVVPDLPGPCTTHEAWEKAALNLIADPLHPRAAVDRSLWEYVAPEYRAEAGLIAIELACHNLPLGEDATTNRNLEQLAARLKPLRSYLEMQGEERQESLRQFASDLHQFWFEVSRLRNVTVTSHQMFWATDLIYAVRLWLRALRVQLSGVPEAFLDDIDTYVSLVEAAARAYAYMRMPNIHNPFQREPAVRAFYHCWWAAVKRRLGFVEAGNQATTQGTPLPDYKDVQAAVLHTTARKLPTLPGPCVLTPTEEQRVASWLPWAFDSAHTEPFRLINPEYIPTALLLAIELAAFQVPAQQQDSKGREVADCVRQLRELFSKIDTIGRGPQFERLGRRIYDLLQGYDRHSERPQAEQWGRGVIHALINWIGLYVFKDWRHAPQYGGILVVSGVSYEDNKRMGVLSASLVAYGAERFGRIPTDEERRVADSEFLRCWWSAVQRRLAFYGAGTAGGPAPDFSKYADIQAALKPQPRLALPGVRAEDQGRPPEPADPKYPVALGRGAYETAVARAMRRLSLDMQVRAALTAMDFVWPLFDRSNFGPQTESAELAERLLATRDMIKAAADMGEPHPNRATTLDRLAAVSLEMQDLYDSSYTAYLQGYTSEPDHRHVARRYFFKLVLRTAQALSHSVPPRRQETTYLLAQDAVVAAATISGLFHGGGARFDGVGIDRKNVDDFLTRWWSAFRRQHAFADAPTAEVSGPKSGPKSESSSILGRLNKLRPQIATAAQAVITEESQARASTPREDWEHEGGICDDVAAAILGVIDEAGMEAMTSTCGESFGGFHTSVLVKDERGQAIAVDVPYQLYETPTSAYSFDIKAEPSISAKAVVITPLGVDFELTRED